MNFFPDSFSIFNINTSKPSENTKKIINSMLFQAKNTFKKHPKT